MVYKFNRKLYVGMSFAGVGGGGTRYTKLSPLGFNFLNPVGRTGISDTLGMNYALAHMSMTAAYKVNKKHTIAASPVIGLQTFRAFGLGVFQPFSSDPENLTGRGNDFAYGAGIRLGWQGKMTDWLTLGAAYSSKIYFTKFDKYKGLFAEQGSMDTPEDVGLGFSLKPIKDLTIAFDWKRVFYSDVRAIGNPIENLAATEGFLGEAGGAGFGCCKGRSWPLPRHLLPDPGRGAEQGASAGAVHGFCQARDLVQGCAGSRWHPSGPYARPYPRPGTHEVGGIAR